MALLLLQAVSELIKRIAYLQGRIPDPLSHEAPGQKHGEETAELLGGTK
jgi:TRAP-type mannitol/chloroaromatic compound transport system permease small subunit